MSSERPGLSGPEGKMGLSSGERGGYCSRRITERRASHVDGSASLMNGSSPARMYRKRYVETPIPAMATTVTANISDPTLAA